MQEQLEDLQFELENKTKEAVAKDVQLNTIQMELVAAKAQVELQ